MCTLWAGRVGTHGYGVTQHEGQQVLAHRLAFFEANGYWPEVCRHTCDTPLCIDPAHLVDGTQADNVQDMMQRGRHGRGNKPAINVDMPPSGTPAYHKERYRRIKAGTWNQQGDHHEDLHFGPDA